MTLPTVPVAFGGAISPGSVHITGPAVASPTSAMVIQNVAPAGVWARAAPPMARASSSPEIMTALRTRVALMPLAIMASTSHPAMRRSLNVANAHGTAVYPPA